MPRYAASGRSAPSADIPRLIPWQTLLHHSVGHDRGLKVADDGDARHGSGSFYTPEEPVQLIIAQAVGPLVRERMETFEAKAAELAKSKRPKAVRLEELARLDPATRILEIKVCDPAMGSGHFLVSLVDYLADRVLEAVAQAEELVDWAEYHSPLTDSIGEIRSLILARKREKKWTFDEALLDDKQMVRRIILKRVVYGVDKNPMAVELAKVSLWLHTFTAGAPLSFLEHHLRCGDSICGEWIRPVEDDLAKRGAMFLHGSVARTKEVAKAMTEIERLADADIAQVKASSNFFDTVNDATVALSRFLDFVHVLRRREKQDKPTQAAVQAFYDGQFGDPVKLAAGLIKPKAPAKQSQTALIPSEAKAKPKPKGKERPAEAMYRIILAMLAESRRQALKERFLHWQVAFPGLWEDWESGTPKGGFDAVIGNPPYVRQELLGPAKPFLRQAYASFDGVADLYVYFYELGLKILKPGGRLSFIVTNKWMKAGYAEALRRTFAEQAWMESVVDFGHAKQIFKDADVFPCVIVARKPTPAEPPPDETRICVIDRDKLRLDALIQQVEEESFTMPRERLGAGEWRLESPDVLALMDKVRDRGIALRDFIGAEPLYGLKTGYNEAFLIDSAARNNLVEAEIEAEEIIRPYLRGQDIDRWSPAWDGLWMIVMKSSANHPWPWANEPDETAAEEMFRKTYPRLHAHMKSHEAKLRARQDRGRFWWELRACAYYDQFESAKVVYQEIQFHPSYALDSIGQYGNNKTFFLPTTDLYLLGVLNSPLMWWHNWRFLPHMKDEALNPAAFRMGSLPIAEPTPAIRETVETNVSRLVEITADLRKSQSRIFDWLATEMAAAKPGLRLRNELAALSSDDFVAEVKKARKDAPLSPGDLARLREAHSDMIAPARALLAEASQLECAVSDLVNQAYGLTPAEVELMWKTAPPRMPFKGGI